MNPRRSRDGSGKPAAHPVTGGALGGGVCNLGALDLTMTILAKNDASISNDNSFP